MKHRFSIVIPTRDRAHTLPFTLRTCLAQEFSDFEIIVADNCSTDPIRAVVEELADARIRYVRSDRLLAMSDSWEFALAHADGEFVTLLGNDDGLLLHALPEIDRLIRMLDAKILRWESACYNWPDLPAQEHAAPNTLLLPLKQDQGHYAIQRRESIPMMQAAANSRISYSELPMIYCSALHHSVIDQLRTQTGRVFRSRSPDVYSSFAFAYLAGSYFSVAAPMSINGLSGQSNGVACIYLNGKSPIADEFHRLNAQASHEPHPQAPSVLVMPAGVADSFLHARDMLFPDDSALSLDRKQLAINCIEAARLGDEPAWQQFRAEVRRSMIDDAGLLAWFDGEYGRRPLAEIRPERIALKRYAGPYLCLDAAEFGVANILQAVHLCEKLLGGKRDGLNCHLEPEPENNAGRTAAPLAAEVTRTCCQGKTMTAPKPVADLQWVESALSRLLSALAPTKYMIDVGAHFGTSLEPFLLAGWKVCAFEPIEANRAQLETNFGAMKDLVIRPEAVSNASGTKAFHLALNLDGSLHEYHHSLEDIAEDPWHRKGPTVSVPTVRLDDLVARGDIPVQVGFLKVDTEGHDLAVLQGAAQLECDAVCVEFWGDDHALGKSPSPASAMVELMRERGFRSFLVLCHDGDATVVLQSTFDGARPDSWGNIVFFRDPNLCERIWQDRDWQMVLEMSAESNQLHSDLRAKEAVIQELSAAQVRLAAENRELNDAVSLNAAAAAERLALLERLDAECAARLRVIEQLDEERGCQTRQVELLGTECKNRQSVIDGLCHEINRLRSEAALLHSEAALLRRETAQLSAEVARLPKTRWEALRAAAGLPVAAARKGDAA